jgi:peptidyl-prolyl cis-trans isomerase A (cyclophilin A)
MSLPFFKSAVSAALLLSSVASISTFSANATIVEFTTSQGDFKINLHDSTTPNSVQNFLNYVVDQDYNNTVVHRVVDDFVLQGGGFSFSGELPLSAIETDQPVVNEPVYSNVRGTIAMAKVAGNANSATSQWFINLNNNSGGSAQLDVQNGGFTVFGEVVVNDSEDGMAVIDAIAALPRCGDSAIPLNDNSEAICQSPGAENFVTIYSINVYDDTINTDASLASIENTAIDQQNNNNNNNETNNSSGGGSLSWLSLFMLGLCTLTKTVTKTLTKTVTKTKEPS